MKKYEPVDSVLEIARREHTIPPIDQPERKQWYRIWHKFRDIRKLFERELKPVHDLKDHIAKDGQG